MKRTRGYANEMGLFARIASNAVAIVIVVDQIDPITKTCQRSLFFSILVLLSLEDLYNCKSK